MVIYRKVIEYLKDWKATSNKKPLVIRGARQVGKTFVVNEFAQTYPQKLLLNFERPGDKELFESRSLSEFVEYIYLKNGFSKEKETLLFLDEIQESAKAIESLRFFYEDYSFIDVVSAGSLLEFTFEDIKSFPVGRVHQIPLYPVCFEEFLLASQPQLIAHFNKVPVSKVAHELLINQFNLYTMIGGMPEVLDVYLKTKDFLKIQVVYNDLWQGYKQDIEKYAKNETDKRVLRHILNYAHLEKDRIKYQNFAGSGYRSREVSEAFQSLEMAKIIQPIHPATQTNFPPIANHKRSPRLQYLDTGLFNYISNIQADLIGIQDLSNFMRGKIIQHVVSQEFIAHQKDFHFKPLFWVRENYNSNAEVDNLYIGKDFVLPIEIKSGKAGSIRSLMQFIDEAPVDKGVRLSGNIFSVEDVKTIAGKPFKLYNIPYYHAVKISEYLEV
jgi:predicted AAA+ superfamily ATPase